MIDIKMILVKSLIGTKLDGVPGDRPEQKLIRSESRESVPILPWLVNQRAPGSSVVNLAVTLPFDIRALAWQKITALVNHTLVIKFFAQHMQSISKWKK